MTTYWLATGSVPPAIYLVYNRQTNETALTAMIAAPVYHSFNFINGIYLSVSPSLVWLGSFEHTLCITMSVIYNFLYFKVNIIHRARGKPIPHKASKSFVNIEPNELMTAPIAVGKTCTHFDASRCVRCST